MAYQTLYRKYRPKSFELVYGQDVIVKTLKNVINKDKLSHAYLFTGPRGTGKTSCAKLFAKAINCLNNIDGDACNNCSSCKTFNNNSNPDIIEIDAASNNGVDEIREIKSKINLVPAFSKYKIYIIDEVHMLSIGAFNALLKTLEEPPKYIIFILATTEPQKLPSTVISRCQRFDFKSISPENMMKCLNNIVLKENINIETDALKEIISLSNGGLRDAISLLDQSYAFSEELITIDDIHLISGSVSNLEIMDFVNKLISNDYKYIIEKIDSWYNNGKDFTNITQKIIDFLINGMLYIKNIIKDEKEIYSKFNLNSDDVYHLIMEFTSLYEKIRNSIQKKLLFELTVIKLLNLNTNNDSNSNVSRETLELNNNQILKECYSNKTITNIDNKKIDNDVSRETLELPKNIKKTNETVDTIKINFKKDYDEEIITKIKNIRINNILLNSNKTLLINTKKNWDLFNEYLTDDKFKKISGILLESKPVAVSKNGIIISLPSNVLLNNIENNYDLSKELFTTVFNIKNKIVYITDDYWNKIRPEYVIKVKNKELKYQEEDLLLSELKKKNNNTSIKIFDELIEMENK